MKTTTTSTPKDNRERVTILSRKDLDISYFVGSGAGGQNKQKNATGVKIVHRASGAIGQASDTRSRDQNKRLAFERLCATPKMKVWINAQVFKIQQGEYLEDRVNRQVEEAMRDSNIRVEVKDENGCWVAV